MLTHIASVRFRILEISFPTMKPPIMPIRAHAIHRLAPIAFFG